MLKPIETIYDGYRFRSRREARWAVFFNALRVWYEYEPEGFKLPSGGYYLPDFRVRCHGTRGACREPKTMDDTRLYGLCYACRYGRNDSYAYEADCTNKSIGRDDYGGVDGVEIDCDCNNVCTGCDGFMLEDDGSFDLYIEVKGFMTQDDADRIIEFSKSYPVLVVGNIPQDIDHIKWTDGMNGTNVCPFNYETIDGDYFGAYPAAHNGCFYLMGADSNYMNRCDVDRVNDAFAKARQARFEHGEKPRV